MVGDGSANKGSLPTACKTEATLDAFGTLSVELSSARTTLQAFLYITSEKSTTVFAQEPFCE